MKKLLPLAAACTLFVPVVAFGQGPESSASLYKKGVAAEAAGNAAGAKEFYSNALKVDPNNANARNSLGNLKLNYDSVAARGRESKLGAVVIPTFQLDEATLQEAMAALATMIEKESKGDVAPNFIIEDPKKALAAKKISLNLKSMPAKAIIKYVLDQTGAKARYDEHAVVIMPR